MRSRLPILVFVAAAILSGVSPAPALEGGIFDCAREGDPDAPCLPAGRDIDGCGSCHGGLLPKNTTTLVTIEGLPENGWVAGESYELIVNVLGPHVPVPDGCPGVGPFPALTNVAGFNLEITGGSLAPLGADPTVRVQNDTACDRLRRITGCGEPYAPPCPADCDDTVTVNAQATHSILGNSQRSWAVRWTPPASGYGDVAVHLAGNSVNGNCRPDAGDLYTIAPARILPERE